MEALRSCGVFSFDSFKTENISEQRWVLEGLIADPSVNILIGNSGLGKTPLGIALGLSVAAGRPFLGREVTKGRVLYCDSESDRKRFHEMVHTISVALGLSTPPNDFLFWSPYWEKQSSTQPLAMRLLDRVKQVGPQLVMVDPLRTFWPQ